MTRSLKYRILDPLIFEISALLSLYPLLFCFFAIFFPGEGIIPSFCLLHAIKSSLFQFVFMSRLDHPLSLLPLIYAWSIAKNFLSRYMRSRLKSLSKDFKACDMSSECFLKQYLSTPH